MKRILTSLVLILIFTLAMTATAFAVDWTGPHAVNPNPASSALIEEVNK